jgi:hypothetical protein
VGEGRHSINCENATQPKCVCKGCGGAEHGWPGAVRIASDPSGRKLTELVRAADKQWEGLARIRDAGGEPTGKARRAAIKGALAAVTAWLHRDGDLRGQLEAIGEPLHRKPQDERRDGGGRRPRRRPRTPEEEREFVEAHVLPRLVKEFGTSRVAEFQARAVEAHFWCELFAQTVRALDEYRGLYEGAKRFVVDALTAGNAPHSPLWASILPYQHMVHWAVDLVFELLPRAAGLPATEDVFELIWPTRVLACLMCKDPSEHPAVREYCLNPILRWGQARVREEVRQRMGWTFPDEWPGLGSGEAGAA